MPAASIAQGGRQGPASSSSNDDNGGSQRHSALYVPLLGPLDPLVGLGFALAVGEAADKGGGFRDDAGQVQGLVKVAAIGGCLVHDAVDEKGLGEAAGVGGGIDYDDN